MLLQLQLFVLWSPYKPHSLGKELGFPPFLGLILIWLQLA